MLFRSTFTKYQKYPLGDNPKVTHHYKSPNVTDNKGDPLSLHFHFSLSSNKLSQLHLHPSSSSSLRNLRHVQNFTPTFIRFHLHVRLDRLAFFSKEMCLKNQPMVSYACNFLFLGFKLYVNFCLCMSRSRLI